jgi:hypothetical protein
MPGRLHGLGNGDTPSSDEDAEGGEQRPEEALSPVAERVALIG